MRENYKKLGCHVIIQAVKDYFRADKDKFKQRAILKDLNSPWMDWLTDGLSLQVARVLKTNPAGIKSKLKKYEGGN